MKLVVISLVILLTSMSAYCSDLTEITPNFLLPNKESAIQANAPVKPLVSVKRNSSGNKTWYCNRNKDSVGNVFCNKNSNTSIAEELSYEESGIKSDRTIVIDNSVSGVKFGQNTSANQATLQDQGVKNSLQKSQGNFALPIPAGKDVNMKVNQQQIQFNIKY